MYNQMSTKEIIHEIKSRLVIDYFGEDDINESYLGNIEYAWRDFVDEQEFGTSDEFFNQVVISDLPNIEIISGKIEVDYPTSDEISEYDEDNGDYIETEIENYFLEHNWIKINGDIFEFTKGVLEDYIDWDDIYSVEPEDIGRYKELF